MSRVPYVLYSYIHTVPSHIIQSCPSDQKERKKVLLLLLLGAVLNLGFNPQKKETKKQKSPNGKVNK